jgi:sec-independent protein translocase protein TatB
MFGIGFTELLLISIVAILFLGPDKLPGALVEMAKFIKSVKKTVGEAKSSLEEEMKISDLKEEALNYKKQLNSATDELKGFKNLDFDDFDDVSYDDEVSKEPTKKIAKASKKDDSEESVSTKVETKNETVTLKKKKKVVKKEGKNPTKGDA